jgi:hypothetical protein
MKQKSGIEELARVHIKAIRRVTRKVYSSEEKIRIVRSGLLPSTSFNFPRGWTRNGVPLWDIPFTNQFESNASFSLEGAERSQWLWYLPTD